MILIDKKTGSKVKLECEPLIDTEEAAKLLGIHPKTLQQMARGSRIPAIRVGKFWRFRKSQLDNWVQSGISCVGYAYRHTEEEQS